MDRHHLRPAPDAKALLQRCHTRLHAAGAAGEEHDLTLDMVRLLMAKAVDERGTGPLRFVAGPQEPAEAVAARVRALFAEVRHAHPTVFRGDERITVRDEAILAMVRELGPYRLLPEGGHDDADLMGQAYEIYTATSQKRRRGQFFTNRLVVDLLTEMVAPSPSDLVLDPAGGSGGFVTGALRWCRRTHGAAPALALNDVSPRLAKIATVSLLLSGAPRAHVCVGDGLAASPPSGLPALGQASVVLTNPPFAGTGDGRLTSPALLQRFAVGHRWTASPEGLRQTDALRPDGAPPEVLFLERCLRWLRPGGRLGIVLPKSVLDTVAWGPARTLLFSLARVRAVVTCHRNTFQPHTGVQTALLVAERRSADNPTGRPLPSDPDLFFALSRAAGQDSEGTPVYRRGPNGAVTGALDEDLSAIAADWRAWLAGSFVPSEYRFTRPAQALPRTLNLSPQAHRPSLRARVAHLSALAAQPGWSVRKLGDLVAGTTVFKGSRLRSERLMVRPDAAGGPTVEPYFTPGAVLQGRRDAAKWLDLSRASARQREIIEGLRVRRGDVVVTRSGTVGKVAIIPASFDRAIVSDDLIRVRIPDPRWRLFVWAWLSSPAGQDQLKQREYGAIQQHVEPTHVAQLLVPIPDEDAVLDDIVAARLALLEAREAADRAEQESDLAISVLLDRLAEA